ncbi:16S rRNA (guanine(966)-N(2))-methyltransferase RsmD [Desulfobaculum bizertense]|uniref:16S rRNA (Guanine966-N2)-methyltransferase n=1 Tax=Desulfobaculum bizertense DSM 18034 TaxID=1121442 RepID=A0A1T4WVK9_9BACT|nr:16S rRNA (guanine(966)-N(2))-methyltransferase RsmD [Desulfobaculum bizertense]UIJ38608.1 16S rRNA (guanine(966)-N(2))-methyltransferase RsmD [Desulfobaculum bizertense]SKA81344.1 16S rRNA (guanine966-N2)-methyltransferase [Desulfobaculum bizertense DSM 18034]
MRIISGEFGGRTIRSVEGPGYRPATAKVRGAIFSMLEARGIDWEETHVLDLFAGSGSLTFEALSRGAVRGVLMEKNRKAAACISENGKSLGLRGSRVRVVAKDLFKVLNTVPDKPFSLVFIDPPYGKDLLEPALVKAIANGWIAEDAFVLAEVESGLELDADAVSPFLETLTDKLYGQTRIIVWKKRKSAKS